MSDPIESNATAATTRFTLYGCREILSLAAGAVTIERQIIALEESVEKNPNLAFDLAKALVETTCRTILTDRGHSFDHTWEVSKLFKETAAKLQFMPDDPGGDQRLTEGLKRTNAALVSIIGGLAEIRNAGGFASHGKDGYDRGMEDTIQAQFVARAADAVVHFLFRIHRNYAGPLARTPPIQYRDNPVFNAFIDEQHEEEVQILNLPSYKQSEVLFYTDLNAYRELLAEYESGAFETDEFE